MSKIYHKVNNLRWETSIALLMIGFHYFFIKLALIIILIRLISLISDFENMMTVKMKNSKFKEE